MTHYPDFKDTPLFDVEYLGNDTRQTHGYCRPLIERDLWPSELLLPMTLILVHLSILSEDKCILIFQFLIETTGHLTKDDIVDDLE